MCWQLHHGNLNKKNEIAFPVFEHCMQIVVKLLGSCHQSLLSYMMIELKKFESSNLPAGNIMVLFKGKDSFCEMNCMK